MLVYSQDEERKQGGVNLSLRFDGSITIRWKERISPSDGSFPYNSKGIEIKETFR